MKFKFKKFLAVLLCMTMVFTSTLPHFASGDLTNKEETSETEFVGESESVGDSESVGASTASPEEKVASASEIAEEENDNIEEEKYDDVDVATNSEVDYVEDDEVATPSELLVKDSKSAQVATNSEMKAKLYDGEVGGGFIPLDIKFDKVKELDKGGKLLRATVLPDKYDSRDKTNPDTGLSYISPIRAQNPYGSCWMFSTMAMFEASIRKKGLAKNETESNLSEASLMYYVYKGLKDVTKATSSDLDYPGLEGNDYTYFDGDWADRGGNQFFSTMTASAYVSTLYENADTSYSRLANFEDNVPNYTLDGKYAFNSNDYVVNNIYYINKANRDLMKKAIMDNGAIGISYHAGQARVGTGSDDKYMNVVDGKHYYYTGSGGGKMNHAISVVGWDDTIPNTYFRYKKNPSATPESPAENGGWICRNSWGTDYADDGYFFMSYEEPTLDDDVYAADMIPADTYKYNYHYDTTSYPGYQILSGSDGESVSSSRQAAISNIFKVGSQEQTLDAVSIALFSTI